MIERTNHNDKDEVKNKGAAQRSRKKAALVVVFVCTAVALAVVGLNGDRLSVSSDVPAPSPEEEEEELAAPSPNSPPTIVNIAAATDRITPSGICEVACEAIDPDGDELTYTWSTPHGEIYGEGSAVEWNAPDREGLFRIGVMVDDGRGGTVEYSTSLRVKSNSAPEIQELSADVDWVASGESAYFLSKTSDADGDEISHEWEGSAGEFFGSGASVVWLAPEEEGSYWITIWARDAYGGESKRSMPISVTYRDPPTLGQFRVEGVNTDMLQRTGDAWKIYRTDTCSIECVVDEGDGPFTYEWSVERGTLTSDGPVATWKAPYERVSADVVVRVTDRHGGTVTGSVLIYVETCLCAFG